MCTIYALRSQKDGNLYVGCTEDLHRRIRNHMDGRVFSTKSRLPVVLVYKEEFPDKYEAFKIERFYKTAKGKRELKQRI